MPLFTITAPIRAGRALVMSTNRRQTMEQMRLEMKTALKVATTARVTATLEAAAAAAAVIVRETSVRPVPVGRLSRYYGNPPVSNPRWRKQQPAARCHLRYCLRLLHRLLASVRPPLRPRSSVPSRPLPLTNRWQVDADRPVMVQQVRWRFTSNQTTNERRRTDGRVTTQFHRPRRQVRHSRPDRQSILGRWPEEQC